MSIASNLFRKLRPALPLVLGAASCLSTAHAITIQRPHAIGLTHDQAAPYNFTGRIFDLDFIGFGSGTLLRRHTVLTAGHVVFDPTLGFVVNTTFTRALYEDFRISVSQVISAQALSGYQADIISSGGNANLTAFRNDQGLVLLNDPPVDNNWANYVTTPSLLSNPSSQFFVLGYPGETFDGLTMAYAVPQHPFVPYGSSLGTGGYENDTYQIEEGMSGGPIYVVPDGVHQYVAADTVGKVDDPSGTVNATFVRAIDKSSGKFIADAEYTAGLIKSVTLTGPKKVNRGQTYTYSTTINFLVPSTNGAAATTDRYSELKLKSNAVNTLTTKFVTIVKTSNTTFDVTYTNNLRPGASVTLQVYYDKTSTPVGKSSRIIKVQ